jgi:transcriptional/translational regulatory protein YebC/TACO1
LEDKLVKSYNSEKHMSGQSKWSTIKRKKEDKDISKGKEFSKLSKVISIAAKTGGGVDPDSNFKLRVAIDAARESNMPKENIERALRSVENKIEKVEEVLYEGFGPGKSSILVEAHTDNRNRTSRRLGLV